VGFTATEDLVDLVEEGREDIKVLLIHFCLGHKIYSLLWRRVTLSHIVDCLIESIGCIMHSKSERRVL